LDKRVDIITISTNTPQGQDDFAKKANISNLTFLSDNHNFDFGKNTGLLIKDMGMLRRTVLVVDEKNIIRYVDFVPGGGLPDIKGALNAAKLVLLESS
jgi:thiol peroxidase